jgi:uncharacterized membrane protein YkvI
MNKKGQGIDSLIYAFIAGLVLLLLVITLTPVYNSIFDSQVPLLNTMTNYSTFASLLGMVPVLLVIIGIIIIIRILTQQRQPGY